MRQTLLGQGRDDLLGLRLLDPGIVGALRHQHRDPDVLHPGQRGALPEHVAVGVRVPHPSVHLGEDRFPVLRDRGKQRQQVGRADQVHRAPVDLRGEGRPGQGGISAVGTAVYPHPVAVHPPGLDDVADRVGEVVLHLRAPRLVSRVEESLAVAGGSAVVDLHAQVAAVGQPLRFGVVAPVVAYPRPAVDHEHRRQARALHPGREGEVAVHREPVAGAVGEGLHRRQLVLGQRLPVREQVARASPRPRSSTQ